MRKPGISQQAELVVQRLFVWISRLLPFRPVGQLKADAPERGYARTRRSHVNGLGAGKQVWVKVLALEPEGPEDEEDFALGVQQATPINGIASRQRDGVAACPESLRGSASRAYSPVRPRTFTGFTLVGPVCLSSGR